MPIFSAPDPARQVAKLAADVERLEKTVRRGKAAPNMRDLADGDLFDAADGQVPVYDASVGKWRPGPAGAAVMSVLIGDPVATTAAGDGANVTVPFTDLSSSTHGTPDIVATTPTGSWTLPAGIYSVAAEVRWSTFGGVRELRFVGSGFPAFVPAKMRVAAAAGEETVLTLASGLFHSTGGDVRVIARQTSGGAGTVTGEWLSIVRVAPYTYTP